MIRSSAPLARLLVTAGLLCYLPPLVLAADWAQRRGPANNGLSAETDWSHEWSGDGPPVVWRAEVGTGFSAVVVAEGRAYTAGNTADRDTLTAFDALTGEVRWTHSYPEPLNPKMYEGGPNATMTVDGGRVYAVSRTGKVFCLSADQGTVQWTRDLAEYVGASNGDWGAAGSPLLAGGRLYVNYGSAMTALEADTGRPLWKAGQESKAKYSFTTAVLVDTPSSPLLLAHLHKALYGLNPATGEVRWRHEFGRGYETHSSDPVLTPSGVFISSGDDGGELVTFDAQKAKRAWKNKNLGTFTGTAVLLGSHLYGVDAAGYKNGQQELRCVAVEDGSVKWALKGFSQDSWIASGDRLILLTGVGELRVVQVSPEKGEILARAQVLGGKCWTQPVLSGGRLYCRNARGDVVCLDLRAKKS